jgi:hypothetical protein
MPSGAPFGGAALLEAADVFHTDVWIWDMIIQFLISVVVGCIVFAAMEGETGQARLLGGFLAGLTATWLVMCVYVRIRWGKSARITMDMS